jgi:hypothetical protein
MFNVIAKKLLLSSFCNNYTNAIETVTKMFDFFLVFIQFFFNRVHTSCFQLTTLRKISLSSNLPKPIAGQTKGQKNVSHT